MKLELEPSTIPGCQLLRGFAHEDTRGSFEKLVHQPAFEAAGLEWRFRETYLSRSQRGVIRGLHFQRPPSDHVKLVSCLAGAVLDVVLDLRSDSPTYGQHARFELRPGAATAVLIPRGCAHGFVAHEDDSLLLYLVTTPHDPERDAGVRWDSAGIDWSLDPQAALLSPRDQALPTLAELDNPF